MSESLAGVPAPRTRSSVSKKTRVPRPRSHLIDLTISRSVITGVIVFATVALVIAFGAGFWFGRRVALAPIVKAPAFVRPERIVREKKKEPPIVEPADPVVENAKEEASPPVPEITVGSPSDPKTWGVQIGAYPDLETAEGFIRDHRGELLDAHIFIVPTEIKGRGIWHRVRIGTYLQRSEAEEAKGALSEDIAKDAIVVSYK